MLVFGVEREIMGQNNAFSKILNVTNVHSQEYLSKMCSNDKAAPTPQKFNSNAKPVQGRKPFKKHMSKPKIYYMDSDSDSEDEFIVFSISSHDTDNIRCTGQCCYRQKTL